MGQPLILNRTMSQLANAAFGAKPNESYATLDRLLAAAASEGARLSVMLFSLEGFAEAREQPTALRKALTLLLGILLQQTPDDVYVDCPAPNEFLAILPGASLEQVEIAAEEIRHRFTEAIREIKVRKPLEIRLNGVVAAFPEDGETRRALFNRLREELLNLGEEGGNRVRRVGTTELKAVQLNLPAPLLRRLHTIAELNGESLETVLEEVAHEATR